MNADSKYKFSPERESRVAEALRENLRKRKQQAQKQASPDKDVKNKDKK